MPLAVAPVTFEQYRALQRPVELPTPQQLFDFGVETLVAKGLACYEHADPFRQELSAGLFLLVPPRNPDHDLDHLMSLVVVNGQAGRNYLNPEELQDEIEGPAGPYLMVDIEDGNSRRNIRPSESRVNILAEGRSPYTIWRGIIHAVVFPEVLTHHYLDLVGSRFGQVSVPYLYLGDGRPKLFPYWEDGAHPRWGAPSCGGVRVP